MITFYILIIGLFAVHPLDESRSVVIFPNSTENAHLAQFFRTIPPPSIPPHQIKVSYSATNKTWVSIENPNGVVSLSFPGTQTKLLDSMLSLADLGFAIDEINPQCLDSQLSCPQAILRLQVQGGEIAAGYLAVSNPANPAEAWEFRTVSPDDLQIGIARHPSDPTNPVEFDARKLHTATDAILIRVPVDPLNHPNGFAVNIGGHTHNLIRRTDCSWLEGKSGDCYFMRAESIPSEFSAAHHSRIGHLDMHFSSFYTLFRDSTPSTLNLPYLAGGHLNTATGESPSARCPQLLLGGGG